MARKNMVNELVDKIRRGEICRVQFSELSDKVDSLLDKGYDDAAEAYRRRLIVLNKRIKEGMDAEEKLEEMIEEARLTPLEYLLFDLRYMQNMAWNDIAEKIRSTPELQKHEKSKYNYYETMKRAIEKLKEAGK